MSPRTFTLWPSGLVGRVTIVLLGALALEFAGSTLLYEQTTAILPSAETLEELASRLARTERSLSALPVPLRDHLVQVMVGDGLQLEWSAAPTPPDAPESRPPLPLVLLREQLTRFKPELASSGLQLHAGAQGNDGLFRNVAGSLQLADGSTLHFRAEQLLQARTTIYDLLLSTALFAGGVLLAASMVVHTLAAPLRRLARVANAIGQGPPVLVADVGGPREVRQVARALNGMQSRIATLVKDRTEALAAVSHDLRTPIARLRLRVESLGGDATSRAMEGDLVEMEQMISTVLAFLKGEADPEPRRVVDLASILQTLVDDVVDAGADATYAGPDRCRIAARPLEIKRALSNLVDNAVKYGGSVRVCLSGTATLDGAPAVHVWIEDTGPGIPEAELERVFEPFHRVDASRSAGLGGIGLGLAIVRRAVGRDGGRVTLRNRAGGGLCAEVMLPIGGIQR